MCFYRLKCHIQVVDIPLAVAVMILGNKLGSGALPGKMLDLGVLKIRLGCFPYI